MSKLETLRKRAAEIASAFVESGAVTQTVAARVTEKGSPAPMRKGEYRVVNDDGSTDAVDALNLRIMQKAEDRETKDLQVFNDDVFLLSKMLGKHPTELRFYKSRMHKSSPLRKQMDTVASGEGSDWIPTNFSSEWVRFVDLELKVTGLFRRVPMPTDPYKIPYISALITVYKVAEQTTDAGTKVTASGPTTANFQLDAVKIGARVPFSTELTEDSIVPILPMLREELGHAIGRGIEDAIVNGDTTGTLDSDVTAATDRRKMFRGLRFHAKSSGSFYTDLSTFNTTTVRAVRALMGKYGVAPDRLAWIASAKTYMKHFFSLADVVTKEKYGDQAVALTGELARWDGIPIIVSPVQREDLNTVGQYDSTTTNNAALLLVNRDSFWFGVKREMELKLFEDTQYDQMYLTGTGRYAFNTPWTTDAVCVMGVNVDMA